MHDITQQFHSYLYTLKKLIRGHSLATQKHSSSSSFCEDPQTGNSFIFISILTANFREDKEWNFHESQDSDDVKGVMRKGHVEKRRCFWISGVLFLTPSDKFFLHMIQLNSTF